MPFMIGNAPIRRTLKYLKSCKIYFRDNVRIFSISYNTAYDNHHLGAKEFVFWHLAQIQYNNPSVQVIKLKNLTPTPFIKIYLQDEEPLLLDLDSRTRDEIYTLLSDLASITKTKEEVKSEDIASQQSTNSVYFGTGCKRHCLCEIYEQIPCPAVVPLPKDWLRLQPKNALIIPPHIKLWGLQESEMNTIRVP